MGDAAELRAKYLAEMEADPSDRRHGTVAGYKNGCRCDACRAANTEHNRKRDRQRYGDGTGKVLARVLAEGPLNHGTLERWRDGCRCERCRMAAKFKGLEEVA